MILLLGVTLAVAACSPSEAPPSNMAAGSALTGTKETLVSCKVTDEGVSGLPFSHGRTFRTLDEYLAHLQTHAAPIDQPWWREIRPGVYEHVKRMPGAARETATRDELMKRFCFAQ